MARDRGAMTSNSQAYHAYANEYSGAWAGGFPQGAPQVTVGGGKQGKKGNGNLNNGQPAMGGYLRHKDSKGAAGIMPGYPSVSSGNVPPMGYSTQQGYYPMPHPQQGMQQAHGLPGLTIDGSYRVAMENQQRGAAQQQGKGAPKGSYGKGGKGQVAQSAYAGYPAPGPQPMMHGKHGHKGGAAVSPVGGGVLQMDGSHDIAVGGHKVPAIVPPGMHAAAGKRAPQPRSPRGGVVPAGPGGKKRVNEKKARYEAEKIAAAIPQYPPSRIVLLRRVSWDTTQGLLEDLGSKFGKVLRIIMLRSKNHALIEFDVLEDAIKMVEHYKQNHDSVVDISNHATTIGFCKHQRWVAPEASKTLLASFFDSSSRITECLYISPRLIYQLFSPYGAIEAVIVLPKKAAKNRVQALVQFTDIDQAKSVKELMQGLPVWWGGTTQLALDLLFSKVENISCALLPGSTFIVPREIANMHTALVAKYGSLMAAFNQPLNRLSPGQLDDFSDWTALLKKYAFSQCAELRPQLEKLSAMPEAALESGETVAQVLSNLHKPIADDWYQHKGMTPEEQQKTLQNMEILIHNGGMAATCRLMMRDGDSDSDMEEVEEVPKTVVAPVAAVDVQTASLVGRPVHLVTDIDFPGACSAPAIFTSGVKAFTNPSDREQVIAASSIPGLPPNFQAHHLPHLLAKTVENASMFGSVEGVLGAYSAPFNNVDMIPSFFAKSVGDAKAHSVGDAGAGAYSAPYERILDQLSFSVPNYAMSANTKDTPAEDDCTIMT
ncbi:Polypyrimidine tract-binding protein-like protein 2 [Diplonema papillatum]|nr:Polypyrimidine tract-binding protein-like protein 2 [Diplonema papillatum]